MGVVVHFIVDHQLPVVGGEAHDDLADLGIAATPLYSDSWEGSFIRTPPLLARYRESTVPGWVIRNGSPLPVVLFDSGAPGDDSNGIADTVNAAGRAWLGCVDYRGRRCLRACVTSFLADHAAVDVLIVELERARERARSAAP